MLVDSAQLWWDSVSADLRLRRGESGRRLLEMAGEVGFSPYNLRRAVERIMPALESWYQEGVAPGWAEKLYRQCKRWAPVLAMVPPLGDEVGR